MDAKPPPLEPRLEKKRAGPTSVLSENVNHPPREGSSKSSHRELQEVTLMKNSVVCSSWRPSGMNKVRPRQREKTWAQLETTHRPTAEEHTRGLQLGDGHELNFNHASNRLSDRSRGPCKPLDLLAKRGLCLVGGDVTDAGASEPASCSSASKNPVRLLVGVRRENLTVKDDKTNESLCQTCVASTMTDGGELSFRRSAGFILKDKDRTRAIDRDVRGVEIVKAIKTYSTSALTPLGKQKSIAAGRRSSRLVNYRVCAATRALHHRGLGMRDLGRGIRDTEVAGTEGGTAGVRMMVRETDRELRQTEKLMACVRAAEILGEFAVICVYVHHVLSAIQLMWASGCEYCLATDSLVVSVITGGPGLIKSDHVLRQCFANPWNTPAMLQERSMWLTAQQ
ncbi:hypothetical protein Q8A73_014745 [Channa argus]|nr:hypothetical protein Q8A73_014745 [Channa argus]